MMGMMNPMMNPMMMSGMHGHGMHGMMNPMMMGRMMGVCLVVHTYIFFYCPSSYLGGMNPMMMSMMNPLMMQMMNPMMSGVVYIYVNLSSDDYYVFIVIRNGDESFNEQYDAPKKYQYPHSPYVPNCILQHFLKKYNLLICFRPSISKFNDAYDGCVISLIQLFYFHIKL